MATSTYEKDAIFSFLKKLQIDINAIFNEMKLDFEKNPPVSNIKDRFLVNFFITNKRQILLNKRNGNQDILMLSIQI